MRVMCNATITYTLSYSRTEQIARRVRDVRYKARAASISARFGQTIS